MFTVLLFRAIAFEILEEPSNRRKRMPCVPGTRGKRALRRWAWCEEGAQLFSQGVGVLITLSKVLHPPFLISEEAGVGSLL